MNVKIKNGQVDGEGPTNMGYFMIGVNAFAGFDYYLTKNLFIGTEFGLGLQNYNYFGVTINSDVEGFEKPDPIKQGSSTSISRNVNGAVRLGFLF